jgi:hypothetical protein
MTRNRTQTCSAGCHGPTAICGKLGGLWAEWALLLAMSATVPALAQHERGELRIKVRDPRGEPLAASVEILSKTNQVYRSLQTDQEGSFVIRGLPFGPYIVFVAHEGFLPSGRVVEIYSEVPTNLTVMLTLRPVEDRITVTDTSPLVDTKRISTVSWVGSQQIRESPSAQMGRTLSDLVDAQPGWLHEANGVLHPRGSEYAVQFVVNGVPLTENRSPAFAPPVAAEDVESMRVLTAGFPAEYGRKLGGVVEVNGSDDSVTGLHWNTVFGGGSFSTLNGYLGVGYGRRRTQLLLTAYSDVTDRYLDPPVTANFTNHASQNGFSSAYSADISERRRLRLSLRHSEIRYHVPNELVQQEAGQRQDAFAGEMDVQANYQHILAANLLLSAEGSVRQVSFDLWSNSLATPIILSQQRGFSEGYGRVTVSGVHGAHSWKAGADTLFSPVHEALQYAISNPLQFDPGVAPAFHFFSRHTGFEPSAFVQDEIHYRSFNLSVGLRYDFYSFLVSESALSPRLAMSYYYTPLGFLLHASYDRTFQTPASENLLLASSPETAQISHLSLRLPVPAARANYYEFGLTKGVGGCLRLDTNIFRREFRNYPDDDTLFNSGVSFPIADARATIQGFEARLQMPRWGRFSGFMSFANQVGVAEGPITGGLFIGAEAIASVPEGGRFRISQDQRNTARARLRFQANKRIWLAMAGSFGSGLPVDLDTGNANYAFLLAQYGPRVLGEVNFAHGRVRPSYSLDASIGVDIYRRENKTICLEAQGFNLTNRLNVINFASLFSGTAIAPPRSAAVRVASYF